jgi:peptidoglycan/LPS O-acetylase OafA/YrhL
MSLDVSRSGKPISGPLYLPTLDGLRGLALLSIVFFHIFFAAASHPGQALSPDRTQHAAGLWADLSEPVQAYFGSTHYWLSFFFVLSGFVLFLPIAAKGEIGSIRSFAIRRVFRILPAYYVSIVVLLLLIPTVFNPDILPSHDPLGIFQHLTLVQQEFAAPGFGINGVLWTMSMDAIFYLLLPLIAGWYFRHPFIGLAIGMAIGIGWLVASPIPAATNAVPITGHDFRWLVQFPLFADDHALGMTSAWVVVYLMRNRESIARRLAVPFALGSLVLALVLIYVSASSAKLLTMFNAPLFFAISVPILLTVFLSSTVFLPRWGQWPLANPLARWLGDISYSAYLYHGMVLAFGLAWLNIDVRDDLWLALAIYFPATTVVAYLGFVLVERPFRRMGHRLARKYGRPRAAPAPAPVTIPGPAATAAATSTPIAATPHGPAASA